MDIFNKISMIYLGIGATRTMKKYKINRTYDSEKLRI